MNVLVSLPEEFAARFGPAAERDRRVLEALAMDEYRSGRMSRSELRQVLGFPTRAELDGFLKLQGVVEGTTTDEFEQDLREMERAGF